MRRSIFSLAVMLLLSFSGISQAQQLIYFDQPESVPLFDQAKLKGDYWDLARYFVSEYHLTFCGIATTVMVLNALEVKSPVAPTIFPFSKFDQENVFTPEVLNIKSLRRIDYDGLTLPELHQIVASFDLEVTPVHAADSSPAAFREAVQSTLADASAILVVNFARKALQQEGPGHISPVAAYHSDSDRVLVMDVARYKYPPVWVTIEELFNAMNTVDTGSQKSRGFMIVRNNAQ